MEKCSCKTYFSVNFEIDREKNAALLKERRDCAPEEIGIFNKEEVERYLVEAFGVEPLWRRHHFVIGLNENYDIDVNKMLRVTLKDLLGKEEQIRIMQQRFAVETVLEIVPYLAAETEEPRQYLTLERDILEFLYRSETAMDLDYYIF